MMDAATTRSLVLAAQAGDKGALSDLLDEAQFALRAVWVKFVDRPDEGMLPDEVSFFAPEDAESIAVEAFIDLVLGIAEDKAQYVFSLINTSDGALGALNAAKFPQVTGRHASSLYKAMRSMRTDVGATGMDGKPEVAGLSVLDAAEAFDVDPVTLQAYLHSNDISVKLSFEQVFNEGSDSESPFGDEWAAPMDDWLPSDADQAFVNTECADFVEPSCESSSVSADLWTRVEGALGDLAPRQRQVMDMVANGMAAVDIAADLGIAVETVKATRKQSLLKLRSALD
jgi:hypothetical protein